MVSHTFSIRIYYEDTDFSGNVYHAAYLKFMERARTEFLRERGVHHRELLEKNDMAFAVRNMDIWFDRPAHIDDELEVMTELVAIRGARMELSQKVLRDEEVLMRATVIVVSISMQGRPKRLSPEIVEKLSAP